MRLAPSAKDSLDDPAKPPELGKRATTLAQMSARQVP
jgi:hypothetical protein